MEEYGQFLNVIDIEATCWAGAPPRGQPSEIIEIGLCVIDTLARDRVEKHRLLLRPTRSKVSEFCTELTGLTQAEVDSGISYAEACEILTRDHRADSRQWVSWGDYDRNQFQRQCVSFGVRYPFGSRHTNAKAVFTEAYGLRRRPGMANALSIAGLPLEGRHHSGADDAWNIAALVLDIMRLGLWPTDTPSGNT